MSSPPDPRRRPRPAADRPTGEPVLRDLRAVDVETPRRRDVHSAGRTLLVVLGALVLAALFNAGTQLERAERSPLGADRDRKIAIWEPLADLTGAIGLQLPRDAIQAVRDIGEPEPVVVVADTTTTTAPPATSTTDAPGATTTTTAPTTTTTEAPRVPTAVEPLRVLLVGDSTMDGPGKALQRRLAETGLAESVLDDRPASGFSRPDFFDWPSHIAGLTAEHDPEVVVLMFGGNDAQGFEVDGVVHDFGSPSWIEIYRSRIDGVTRRLVDEGRRVIWIGQPTMRSDSFDARIQVLNGIFVDVVRSYGADVRLLDTIPLLTPDGYTTFGPGADGSETRLRGDDGIHLTVGGGDVVGQAVMGLLRTDGILP